MSADINEMEIYGEFNRLYNKFRNHKENIRSMLRVITQEAQKLGE